MLPYLSSSTVCRWDVFTRDNSCRPLRTLIFFRQQAAKFGFDELSYLNALRKVPVVTEERVRLVMGFLCRMAEMIGESGLARRRAEDTGLIAEEGPAVLFRWKANEDWPVTYVSKNITRFGYTPEHLMSCWTLASRILTERFIKQRCNLLLLDPMAP